MPGLLQRTVSRNIVIKAPMVRAKKEVKSMIVKTYFRGHLNNNKQTIGRNMYIKTTACEGTEGNDNNVIGNQRKGHPCCKVRECLAELCPGAI